MEECAFAGHLTELPSVRGEAAPRPRRNLGEPCFPNPCWNQGDCTVVGNNANCTCKPGFTGLRCKEMVVKLECREEFMRMLVRKEAFEMLKIPLASLHLNSRTCLVSEQWQDGVSYFGAKLTGENHTACGSTVHINETHVSYTNVIESGSDNDQSVITRSVRTSLHFSCIYASKQLIGLNYVLRPVDKIVQFAVKEGDFKVIMELYENASYVRAYPELPRMLHITDMLYVLLQIEGRDQAKYFFLGIEDCWGTPTADPLDRTNHFLIMKGCPHDKTLTFLNAVGNSTVAKFSFQMFQFKNFQEVYLHCQVRLCVPENKEPCAKQCPSKQRSKRELVDDYRKIISYGPIRFLASSPLEVRDAEDQQLIWRMQLWIPGAVVSASIAVAIILIAVAKAMKK
ncbi:uromodulin-like [Zootoca vivipara]|uniref:uromodulin-like n=1 Tax=Zootoca vivipara TaxID=8524 RepID=UPI00293BEEFE|nr:uromodulin-like [Zootoca vivipara]